jgi:hypothetical protein
MAQQARFLIVVALVLLAAGAAAAQSLLAGPSPGLGGNNTTVAQSTTQGSTPTTTPTSPGGTTGATGTGTTTPGATTGGTPTTTPSSPTATPGAAVNNGMAIDQIVSLTRTLDASVSAVNAFTVPAGRLLVITDVVITNAGAAPACGASISAGGTPAAPTAPTTPGATPGGTPAATTSESGTGVLCVPAQASLNLGLTTGLEFDAGQSVVLSNAQSTSGAVLHYHLRGFLATPSGV